MPAQHRTKVTRRRFLHLGSSAIAGASLPAVGPLFLFPRAPGSSRKQLKILQWKHPVDAYDRWFEDVFASKWRMKNDTEVIVDHAPITQLHAIAKAEIAAGRGHDLTMFISPPALYEEHVIDHGDIYREAQTRHGQVGPLAYKSTFNPRTKRHFAFCDCYMPAVSNWLIPPWVHLGLPGGPNDYDNLRTGARQIKKEFGIPCGLSLAPNQEGNVSLVSLLWSFGGNVSDGEGHEAINSRETIEALKYVRNLYRESQTAEMPGKQTEFDANAILKGRASYTMNSIALTRCAQKSDPAAVKNVAITPPLRGAHYWLSCPHITSCYVIWRFAENQEGAKSFLVDLIDDYKAAFQASQLCNLPSFPSVAPDLLTRLKNDPQSDPPYKYMALEDALHWTRNIGYPGYASAASAEAWDTFVVPRMFRRVSTGEQEPQESAAQAYQELRQIFSKWPRAGGR